mmetsp:Transcript_32747/g.24167  ORF Transcript_32747/g.24167 Transcript_32747/m.24167 type:complete len:120 (-) Transcript_32747:22-381(-)
MSRLAITRAFGDFEYKVFKGDNGEEIRKYFLSNHPEVRMVEIDPFIDDFLVLASDGLFDKMPSSEVVSYVRTKLGGMGAGDQDLKKVAKDITNEVLLVRHTNDNVTVIIVQLNRGLKLT